MSGQGWTKGLYRPKRSQRSAFACKVATPKEDALPFCPIPGCGRPPQARIGRGFSLFHCRYHVQHKNRHGSLWKGTYSASELKPYRKAAESFLKANPSASEIVAALSALHDLQFWAGPEQRMVDVLTMPPKRKARAFFARLRSNVSGGENPRINGAVVLGGDVEALSAVTSQPTEILGSA